MALRVVKAVEKDIPQMADVYFASFQNPMALAGFPDTPSVRAWWTKELHSDMDEPDVHFLKVVDDQLENGHEIIAFAEWHPPRRKSIEASEEEKQVQWPEDGDHAMLDDFFAKSSTKHDEVMGMDEHWYLEILGTSPQHQGRGAASKLMSYACDRADQTGHKCYLEASPVAVSTYRRFGFEEQDRFSVTINGEQYVNLCMVRQPQPPQ